MINTGRRAQDSNRACSWDQLLLLLGGRGGCAGWAGSCRPYWGLSQAGALSLTLSSSPTISGSCNPVLNSEGRPSVHPPLAVPDQSNCFPCTHPLDLPTGLWDPKSRVQSHGPRPPAVSEGASRLPF